MNKEEKKCKKEYLEEILHLICERLNDSYGQPLLEELIVRMERTVSHFNEEVDVILDSIKSRTQNQHYKLATLRGDDPIKNALNEDEVDEMDKRLNEQFLGEEKHKVGSKVRGDEGLGEQPSEEEKVSRLVWNLINKGDCFLKLIDHPKILPLIKHLIGDRVCLCSMGAHMNGSGNEKMALHQDQCPLVPHQMDFPFMANVMYLISDNSPENGWPCD